MANRIHDAEFEDISGAPSDPKPAARATAYGRRTIAAVATDPKARARAGAEALDAIADIAKTTAKMAQAVGADKAAEKAVDAAELAEAGADLVRTGVVAAEGVAREVGPLRRSFDRLVDRAKAAGLVGAPKRQVLVLRKRPVGPVRRAADGAPAEKASAKP
jgi:hypothetical protein